MITNNLDKIHFVRLTFYKIEMLVLWQWNSWSVSSLNVPCYELRRGTVFGVAPFGSQGHVFDPLGNINNP